MFNFKTLIENALNQEIGSSAVSNLLDSFSEKAIVENDDDFDEKYYYFNGIGVCIAFEERSTLKTVFLHFEKEGDCGPYINSFECVSRDTSVDDVISAWGEPFESSLKHSDDSVLDSGVLPWLLYSFDGGIAINVEFNKAGDSIRLVTIMDENDVPR